MCRYSVLLLVAAQLAIFISAFPQNEASLPDGSKKFLTGKDYEHGDHVPDDEMTREESIDKVEKERTEIIEANLKDPNIIEGDIIVPPNANGSIHRRSVYSDERMLWPNGRVPYEIRSSYDSKQ
ncbi:unnamed protein product [Anisakis simplex]|uniref:Peptidase M12A domain-containing protein n=1 Tax=Anisakis simplex TaxID=6269 RepID=A0A0M3JA37_ANISI|nr:unnamed protein product [Anisakis simplex]